MSVHSLATSAAKEEGENFCSPLHLPVLFLSPPPPSSRRLFHPLFSFSFFFHRLLLPMAHSASFPSNHDSVCGLLHSGQILPAVFLWCCGHWCVLCAPARIFRQLSSTPYSSGAASLWIFYCFVFSLYFRVFVIVLVVGLRTRIMLMASSREGNSLGVDLLLILEKWASFAPKGVCINRSIL